MVVSLCSPSPTRNAGRESGFTLVEILTVISIMLALFLMLAPAIKGLRGAGDLTKTAFDISGLLDGARAQAMAKNAYVWVGFASDQDASSAVNERQLVIVVKTSADGAKPLSLDTASLVTLGKAEFFRNVQLTSQLSNYGGKKSVVADKQLADATTTNSFKSSLDGVTYEFKRILEFNSSGEVRAVGDTLLSKWIEVGLQPTHGNTADTLGNTAALKIAGLTGQARIFRP